MKVSKYMDIDTHEIVILMMIEDDTIFVMDYSNDILTYDIDFFNEYFRKVA